MGTKITHYVTRVREGFIEGICVIKVDGSITIGDASVGFRDYIQEQISAGHRNFIFDFSETRTIDSSGFGELVSASSRIHLRTGKIVLIPSWRVRDQLTITRLSNIYEIASDIQDAVNKFQEGKVKTPFHIEYEDKFSISVEKDKEGEKLVVSDNISNKLGRTEYRVRKIPPDDAPKRLNPSSLIIVVFVALFVLALTIGGLIWAAKAISSVPLLILIFTLAILIFIMLCALVLLMSGHLSEKAASKLFVSVLGKLPGLSAWLPKNSASKFH